MIYRTVPFQRWHGYRLRDNGLAEEGVFLDGPTLMQLERGNSWTAIYGAEPIAAAGVLEAWRGRCAAWAYMSRDAGPHMLYITKAVKKFLNETSRGRIELTVRTDYELGHRWARMLGFAVENSPGRLLRYGPDGADHTSYVMFN